MERISFHALKASLALLLVTTAVAAEAAPKMTAGSVRYRYFRLAPSFREVGLAKYERISVEGRGSSTATYMCLRDPRIRKTVTSKVHTLKRFRADRRGRLRGTLELYPPMPQGLRCPDGQSMVLVEVVYTGVTVRDTKHRKELRFANTYRWRSPRFKS
ncbi:MAG TPA: hypothetical protein VEX38_06260 [Fimbriimonadaceae bacterium]|nr:hypothetical protein [Fimbriimonadaceae bacterium]